MIDPYRVLGLARNATQKEIKTAYRKLARARHPDVSMRADANSEFAKITEAYRILSDTTLRARLDRGEYQRTDGDQVRARRAATQARENRLVKEEIERFRQDVRARGQAVAVVTTLFLSTFVAAMAQPVLELGAVGYSFLIAFALCGAVYIALSLKGALDTYTYRPQIPSVTRNLEPQQKPFSRGKAITFLVLGYAIALTLGALVGEFAFSDGSFFMYFDRGSIAGIFLFPPIAVMIIDSMRRIGDRA